MLIEKLIVKKTTPEEIIRVINFNTNGLNLIVDNTTDTKTDSGNNVGKTTAVKIIDLCLGAKSTKSLYYDDDTKSENIIIKEFLNDFKVTAELHLVDLKGKNKVIIQRDLFTRGKRYFNGGVRTQEEFWEDIKESLFGLVESHPTLRQLMPKFIRLNGSTDENLIKFLQSTSNDSYETIYLFLFNILSNELLCEKDLVATKISECEKKIKLLEKDVNILSMDFLLQRKEIIENELSEFVEKRKAFDYIDTYKNELQKKRDLSNEIESYEQTIQLLEFDILLIEKSVIQLRTEKSNINEEKICQVYDEAKSYLPELNKKFEEVKEFHNKMIQNRIDFIKNQLSNKNKVLDETLNERNKLIIEKQKITVDLLDEGLLDELNLLSVKIEELSIEKGEINQSIKVIEGAETELKGYQSTLQVLNSKLDISVINEKVSIFNNYFSEICELLYGEKYLFVFNSKWKEQKKFPVSLDQFKGKVGTGMKKGIIVAFDLAYIKYLNHFNIKGPRFVIHDKLENTHGNQLKSIFTICNSLKGQYIIPILKEKIDLIEDVDFTSSEILELSSGSKFFLIE